ncbi:hypothetical protein E2C01_009829 [Portunus trituberculatus]|uniref:Uncharacterized protein n=1 Tax=Portunus trituberculatus TaxID=210409 RepID=A0A5B7D6T6_PORTR|nr:hypothetical protein [Portunus trituberculatus]
MGTNLDGLTTFAGDGKRGSGVVGRDEGRGRVGMTSSLWWYSSVMTVDSWSGEELRLVGQRVGNAERVAVKYTWLASAGVGGGAEGVAGWASHRPWSRGRSAARQMAGRTVGGGRVPSARLILRSPASGGRDHVAPALRSHGVRYHSKETP